MRILLDENLDWRLARNLQGHTVATVPKLGWAGVKNGELLRRANAQFDVLITMDKGIYHQQNLTGLSLAIVTLHAKTNRLADTAPLMPALLTVLLNIQPGEYRSLDPSS
jgi:predicted nuclease of predicted toxin-antitoxin system